MSKDHTASETLLPGHYRQLEESSITPEVVSERGYSTAYCRSELAALGFKPYQQRAPALVVPMYSPDGHTRGYQVKPDNPRTDKKGEVVKYDTAKGRGAIVDVHPMMRERVCNSLEPLLVTEGVKTGDAATSRDMPTVVLAGVWGWCVPGVKPYRLRPSFDHIRLEGRKVTICFDSDCMTKEAVQRALVALVRCLEERGAMVKIIYLPDAPDGSKQGVDDYLAAGGTVAELKALERTFEPADIGKVRMSRNEKLKATIDHLWNKYRALERGGFWRGRDRESKREGYRALIMEAESRGNLQRGGVEVSPSTRTLAENMGVSQPTASKKMKKLEEKGLIRRHKSKEKEKPATYVLLVDDLAPSYEDNRDKSYHEGNNSCKTETFSNKDSLYTNDLSSSGLTSSHTDNPCHATPDLRRLRSSYMQWEWSGERYEHQFRERLGPICGHALEVLVFCLGGRSEVKGLILAMGRDDCPSRFIERHVSRLEAAELVMLEGNEVIAADDWSEKLMIVREFAGEYEAEHLQRERHERARDAYRERDKTKAEEVPEMQRVENRSKPWPHHPTGCRCSECRERFGGSPESAPHPSGCCCGKCYAERRKRKVKHRIERGSTRKPSAKTKRSAPGVRVESEPRRKPLKVDDVYTHGPLCGCDWCDD